jgi:hypothetical protein
MPLFDRTLAWVAATAVILGVDCAYASVATVPDAYPSVQAAIDSGADTVLIHEGNYAEAPLAYRGLVLRGIGGTRPQLGGLEISNPYVFLSRRWDVSGIDFTGPITIATFNVDVRFIEINVTDCTLRSGLQHVLQIDSNDIASLSLTRCWLAAPCAAGAATVAMESDTVDVGVTWRVSDDLFVQHCWFRGWQGPALAVEGDDLAGLIADNIMEDCASGIYGTGFDGMTIASNTIRRMRDVGIALDGRSSVVRGNHVEGCGVGVLVEQSQVSLMDNVVLHSRGTGVWFGQPNDLLFERNVVGFAEGPAVAVLVSDHSNLSFIGNTLFMSLVSGLDLLFSVNNQVLVQNNIAFGNGGWGLKISQPQESLLLSCNDWFGNGAGPVSGVELSDQDLELDPGFCDVLNGDVGLFSDSPLLSLPRCSQIGARGVRCSPPILKTLTVASTRAGLGVEWEFEASVTVNSWIERAEQIAGPWDSIGTPTMNPTNRLEFMDRAVAPDRSYYYRTAWWDRGLVKRSSPISGTWIDAGRLSSVSPNPAVREITVDWVLSRPGTSDIRIYDLAGREVAVVARGSFGVGRHQAHWDGQSAGRGLAPAGMYIVRIVNGERTTSHRVLLLR